MIKRQRYLPNSTRSRVAPAGDSPSRRSSGFTLVEMMVAVVILSIGLLGLTTTSAYVVRMVSGGKKQTIAATVVQSRLEYLRSLPCASITSGTATTRGITEKWVKGATTNQVLFVVDTVRYSVSGSPRVQAYTLTIPCW